MESRQSLDWRHWIAMLCIALVAVFALDMAAEASAACANSECSEACDLGKCDDQDESGAPCGAHHCCHGTTASQPNLQGANVPALRSAPVPTVSDEFIASGHLDALERPPRASTAI